MTEAACGTVAVTRYTLNRAFRIVLRTESTPLRARAFAAICDNNRAIAIVHGLYRALPGTPLKAIAVLLYGLKCLLSLRIGPMDASDIIAAGLFVNERRVVEDFQRLAAGVAVRGIEASNRNLLSAAGWRVLFATASRLPKFYRLCRYLAARCDFMPACRGFSVIAYGIRIKHALAACRPAAALIPSSYAPDSMALAYAAHASGIKVVYTNHAHIAPIFDYIAPVFADVSVLTGRAVLETYRRRSHIQGEIVYKGFLSEENPMAAAGLEDGAKRWSVGIFLTAMTQMDGLEGFARALIDKLWVERIIIRPHPVSLLQEDFSGMCARLPQLQIDAGRTLVDCAKACDFVVCGNSSAVLEVLKAGVPVAYEASLDTIPDDYCGFVAAGLIPRCGHEAEALPRRLAEFYANPAWAQRMEYFDGSYGKDAACVRAVAWRRVASCLR